MHVGLIKWFDTTKGFGVIETPENGEVFLHFQKFRGNTSELRTAIPVVFYLKFDEKKNRKYAVKCKIPDNPEDFFSICHHVVGTQIVCLDNITKFGQGFASVSVRNFELKLNVFHEISKYAFKGYTKEYLLNSFESYLKSQKNRNVLYSLYRLFTDINEDHIPESNTISVNKLLKIYAFADMPENELFDYWTNNGRTLGFFDDDFKISIDVLRKHESSFNHNNLKNLLNFSEGKAFAVEFLNKQFDHLERKDITDLSGLQLYESLLAQVGLADLKMNFRQALIKRTLDSQMDLVNKFTEVHSVSQFDEFKKIISSLPQYFSEDEKQVIKNALVEIFWIKSNNIIKVRLYIEDYIKELPIETLLKLFESSETTDNERLSILMKVRSEHLLTLFKSYNEQFREDKTFSLLQKIIKKRFLIADKNFRKENIYKQEIWEDKIAFEIVQGVLSSFAKGKTEEEKVSLFKKGYLEKLSWQTALDFIEHFTDDELFQIFEHLLNDQTSAKAIVGDILKGTDESKYKKAYRLASLFFEESEFEKFDNELFSSIDHRAYYNIWIPKLGKKLPQKEILRIIKTTDVYNAVINSWIQNGNLSIEEINHFLILFLQEGTPIKTRFDFNRVFFYLEFLSKQSFCKLEEISQLHNKFYDSILWFLNKGKLKNFGMVKEAFIYFKPQQQVKIFKKLFFEKVSGSVDFSVEMLAELARFDLELYLLNRQYNPDVPVDISTDIVIKALLGLKETGEFIVESELLSTALEDMKYLDNANFYLKDYFEYCDGRTIYDYDWHTDNRRITQIINEGRSYYEVEFCFDQNILSRIRTIPGRSWNVETKKWSIPTTAEKELNELASKYKFFINKPGGHYQNNKHLASRKKTTIPDGMTFCGGIAAYKKDSIFSEDFYWCKNEKCFERCESIHTKEEWEKYTLLDFCQILKLNTDSRNQVNEPVKYGEYYKFIGLVNRFNRLVNHLFCRCCNTLLTPENISQIAKHSVVRFECRNSACEEMGKTVYLNDCLNGKCGCIIDSRDSKNCPNGLFICSNCGGCCSHRMLNRRLENLTENGSYIHPELIEKVHKKKGHSERAEYFCYKCGNVAKEIDTDIFECSPCGVVYDTTIYKLPRNHKHLRNGEYLRDDDELPF